MPPRKRRHSAASEETGLLKEIESTETERPTKVGAKNLEVNISERRLTARQQSRQDAAAQLEIGSTDKLKLIGVSVLSADSTSTARQPTRCSTRVVKRPKRDLSPPESPVKKGRKTQPPVTSSSTPETKGKRQWELWSVEDKDSFFEGLCEYGKDFESIQNLIVAKCKKKGSVMPITVKNKEQVRHFYYRTWHKISKLIQPVEDLKKDITELYGLISYSVLRKKLRGGVNPNDKNWQKLNDLVHHGVATIKVKGKRIRVKMPVCSALKRLYSIEENKKEPGPKVPDKVRVEFRPKTNVAWRYVQDLSQNPRLRIVVKPERSFQSLVKFLNKKWKPHRLKNKEMLNGTEVSRQEFRVYPDRSSVMKCIKMQALEEPTQHFSLDKHSKDALNMSPLSNKRKKDKELCSKTVVNTNISCEANKAVISNTLKVSDCKENDADGCEDGCKDCLSPVHRTNCKCDEASCKNCQCCVTESAKPCDQSCVMSCDKGDDCSFSLFKRISESEQIDNLDNCSRKGPVLDARLESSPVKAESAIDETMSESQPLYGNPEISAIMNGENAIFPDLPPIKDTASDISDQSTAGEGTDNLLSPVKSENESPSKINSNSPPITLSNDKTDEIIIDTLGNTRNSITKASLIEKQEKCKKLLEEGWKVDDMDQSTLAELYLMFGQNGELKLEYEWVNVKSEAEILQEKLMSNMDNMLRRLSHIATVEFTDFSKTPGAGSACQLCGQVQGLKQKGRGKDKCKIKKTGKDMAVQTQPFDITKEIIFTPNSTVPVTTCVDGVFRVPVLMPHAQHKTTTTTLSQKDLMSKVTHTTKSMMRPRKLKPVNRGRTGPGSIIQRTILPKNQLVTFFPVMGGGGQIANQNGRDKEVLSQTIVGHPINGIQSPSSVVYTAQQSPLMQTGFNQTANSVSPEKSVTTAGVVEMSLSPEGDQTLMRIPASHIGAMSPESLKAAGLSTVSTPLCVSNTMVTTTVSSSLSKGSLSPPNLSSLLDISFQGTSSDSSKFMDLETSFSAILDENSKGGLAMDRGLTTPPIRSVQDRPQTPRMHSPPVRSLFQPSPAPENQWLNGDVHELSLSSLFESPSKSSSSYPSTTMFNNSLPPSLFNESSRDSQSHKLDVDNTLRCMMNESSIDYVKKFQDLAEQIVESDRGSSINPFPDTLYVDSLKFKISEDKNRKSGQKKV